MRACVLVCVLKRACVPFVMCCDVGWLVAVGLFVCVVVDCVCFVCKRVDWCCMACLSLLLYVWSSFYACVMCVVYCVML